MTRTAPAVDRGPWPTGAGERASLDAFLDWHRNILLWKCAGLTGEQLATAAVPSSALTLLGLLRHMAENERWWFRRRFAGQAELGDIYCTEQEKDGDFDLADAANAEADHATFLAEAELSRRTAAAASLDDEFTNGDETLTLRWVYFHMLEEYARHNGHADLLREATGE